MILAKSRCPRVSTVRKAMVLEVQNASLPEELLELRELRIEVPLQRWNRVVKNVHSDRKLLGGLLSTAALLGEGILQLSVCETSEDGS